ncbi:MAG: hypothetical protein HKN62_02110, partial [Phycisphaerales bacterium]|nr:hypothetical protein [Phycisphaerales bacterium]
MHRSLASLISSISLIAVVATATFMLPDQLSIPSSLATGPAPEAIRLTGVIYDFRGDHPDFAAHPPEAFGAFAATVSPVLGEGDRPVHGPDGYVVTVPWTDSDGSAIAPHLFNVAGTAVVA